jgi:hypothetical protein
MIKRKKKIFITQILFLITGLIILIYTYKSKDLPKTDRSTYTINDEKIDLKNVEKDNDNDVFYNIKYSGLDLEGNRYILKAKKAITNKVNEELIKMDFVDAVFYFKDGTELNVISENGIYNNKTFDIVFIKNVEARYKKDKLYSQKAEYSNFKNYIVISNDVRIESEKGNLFADELVFDIEKKTLDISSLDDDKVNAYIEVK